MRLAAERFWSKVVPGRDACLVWAGKRDRDGYGRFSIGPRLIGAHRWAWEWSHGLIPTHLQIDHLCRNRACVNVEHMELVTTSVNTLRGTSFSAMNAVKTHCLNGHPFTPENTYIRASGEGRDCRTCNAEAAKRYRRRRVTREGE